MSDRRWPYLSPTRAGWSWVGGNRGEVRRILSRNDTSGQHIDDPNKTVLDTLERFDQLLRSLEDDVLALVAEAYFRGSSWSEIAHSLGRSKQTVHQRYHRQVHSKTTHEALRRDLAEAWRWARHIQLNPDDADDVAKLLVFLREQKVAGAAPPSTGAC